MMTDRAIGDLVYVNVQGETKPARLLARHDPENWVVDLGLGLSHPYFVVADSEITETVGP